MEKERLYETPRVFKEIPIELEGAILAGSVADKVSGVKTTGQGTGDFFEDVSSSSTFNNSWGE